MPVANKYVLHQIIGVLNVLTDIDAEIVKSDKDERGYRELIRKFIGPDLENLTDQSRKLCIDSLRYYLNEQEDIFEDAFGAQQESPIIPPADTRAFFTWVFEEVFQSYSEVDDSTEWIVTNDSSAAVLRHVRK